MLENCYEHDYVIAVGSVVSRFLESKKVEHFKMFHPSGLNRKQNSREVLTAHLALLRQFLQVQA